MGSGGSGQLGERRMCRATIYRSRRLCAQHARFTCSCGLRLCKVHLDYHARNLGHHEHKELRGA